MTHNSANFSKNMDILMSHFNLTQSQLAEKLDFMPKTTVNKWFISSAIPNDDTLQKICLLVRTFLVDSCNDATLNDLNTIDVSLILGNPYKFANALNMPWYKVGSIINKARLPVKNLFEPNDRELLNLVGFFNIFYPSVAYRGAFFAAALKVTIDDEFFYFEQFNRAALGLGRNKRWTIDALYQSGSVGRFGKANTSNAILIGDLVGEEGQDVEPFVQFTTFKIPHESRPSQLYGRVMALNFDKDSPSYGHLLATPAVALAINNIPRICSVRELAPKKAYYDLDEMKREFGAAISALKQSPAPWCYDSVVLDDRETTTRILEPCT